jgi:hypothetical protein
MTDEIYVLIWSNEHSAWWKPNSCGYTSDRSEAGAYLLDDAMAICRGANKHLRDAEVPYEAIVPIYPEEKFPIE